MSELPSGAATFLFTDVAGWTRLVMELRDRAGELIDEYYGLQRKIFSEGGGHVAEMTADTFFVVFPRARDALVAAAETQRCVARHQWPHGAELLLRIGIHSGEATAARGRYFGIAVNRASHICSLAHGGQVLVSNATAELAEDDMPDGVACRDLGEHRVTGFERPTRLFQLVGEGLRADFPPIAPAKGLPTGTVTFLFTDIEGSTELTRRLGQEWPEVHAAHRRLLRAAFAEAGGSEVDSQGDAFFAVFSRARHAIAAAASAQRSLHEHDWPGGKNVPVRMGIHTGEPAVGEEGYLGLDVVRAARICSAARGGQVLVSETTRALVRGDDLGGLALRDLGEIRLKDMDEPDRLFELAIPGLESTGELALRTPRSDPVPALRVADRGLELAADALAAARAMEDIGPEIERGVAERLRAAGLEPAPPRRGIDVTRFAIAAAILLTALVPVLWTLTR